MVWRAPLHLVVHLRAGFDELDRLHFHALLQRFVCADALLFGEVAHVLGDFHRAEVRAAHRAEVRNFGALLRQGGVVVFACPVGVEAEVELVFQRNSKRALDGALSRICAPG